MKRLLAALMAWAVASCGDAEPVQRIACAANSQCPSGWHCGPAGVCKADVSCADDNGCCLGERCSAGRCRPRQMCSPTVQCLDPAQTCTAGVCVAKECSADADCGKGRGCLWGRCHPAVPCGGRCGAGQACATLTNRCVPAPFTPCPDGQLPVIANETARMPEGCGLIADDIACRPLPPLPDGSRGLPGQLLATPGGLGHVSYDRTYGDVVIARHQGSPPFALQSLLVVSGLPSGGAVVGDPNGPRGGVAEPGPDHGRKLAALAVGDAVWVAFRDDSGDALRFAVVSAKGIQTHAIAGGNGLGEEIALAATADGLPLVLALAPELLSAQPPRAARLHAFAAKLAAPATAADWQPTVVDEETVSPPPVPCQGQCLQGEACVAQNGQQACVALSNTCKSCLPGQLCAAGACQTPLLPEPVFAVGPRGRGASVDVLKLGNGQMAAAAYSAASGNLAFYRQKAGGWEKQLPPAAAMVGGSKDFGRFVKLAADGDKIIAACEDGDKGRLLVLRETAKGWAAEVADDGARPDGSHRVGADVALARHPFGGLLMAHQDTRRADQWLQRAPKPGVVGERAVIESADMAGFSPSIVSLGSKAWVVAGTSLKLAANGELQSRVVLRQFIWNGD